MFNGGGVSEIKGIDPVDPASLDSDHDGIYAPSSEALLPFGYKELYQSRGSDTVASVGDLNLLVLPIEFSDYPFSSTFESDLTKVLSSQEKSGDMYSESLSSFYAKSSFGKLNLSFTVAPSYYTGMSAKQAYERSLTSGKNLGIAGPDNGILLVSSALKKAKTTTEFDFKAFDKDGNGNIDGVIAIYSCPNFRDTPAIQAFDQDQFYWAYTYWALEAPNKVSPTLNTYFWASYDFLYNKDGQLDAHTFIHEFGHLMGLDDYYIDQGCKIASVKDFNPVGMLDMMDGNILDHNAFSKAVLGWTAPKVIYDSCSLTLRPSESSGDCFLIPSGKWNGTLFDEYFLVEFYTPTGLNKADSTTLYPGRPLGYNVPGIKIFHIDARVICCDVRLSQSGVITEEKYTYYNGYNIKADQYGYQRRFFQIAASNNIKSEVVCDPSFSLIHLIEGSGENTFVRGEAATNAALFYQGETFAFDQTGRNGKASFGETFLPKKSTFNNGEAFPFSISITALDSNQASIQITKR